MKGKELDFHFMGKKKNYPLRQGPHFVKWAQETAGIFKI